MKKSFIIACAVALLSSCSDSRTSNVHAEFYVRGNCEMCKERIDKTVSELPGVRKANWKVETKTIAVDYDSTKVSAIEIEKAVAATGHGTKTVVMDSSAHNKLPMCCKVSGHQEKQDAHSH